MFGSFYSTFKLNFNQTTPQNFVLFVPEHHNLKLYMPLGRPAGTRQLETTPTPASTFGGLKGGYGIFLGG